MTNSSSCPSCGKPVPQNSPGGLCPLCLLGQGLGDASDSGAEIAFPANRTPDAGVNRSQLDPAYAITTPSRRGNQPMPIETLRNLIPQLEILELIGQGGMGSVYKARQTKLDRIVAVKVIRPEVSEDPAFAERFMREARTLARLQHPSIIGVHDFGEVEIRPQSGTTAPVTVCYFVMEYIDGANVRQLIQSRALNSQLIYSIIDQTCEALQYAHDQGVVHRDIKPENLLVDARGRVKIADFGLAKLADGSVDEFTLTGTHQVMGTPSYMAPEQIMKSRDVDHRADIYSLGVVLYEMLTGSIPLGRFAPASAKAGSDQKIDDLIHQALATEPDGRFANISQFRSKLISIIERQPAATSPANESQAAAAHGLSTIIDREVAGIWRVVGGTPVPETGSRHGFPILSMLALCLAGGACLFAPWFDVTVSNAMRVTAENSVTEDVGRLQSLHGYDLITGRILGVVLSVLAVSLGISTDRSRTSIFMSGGCAILSVISLLLCFASYGEAWRRIAQTPVSVPPNSVQELSALSAEQPALTQAAPTVFSAASTENVGSPADTHSTSESVVLTGKPAQFVVHKIFFMVCVISICTVVFSIALLRQSILQDLSPLGSTAQGNSIVSVKLSQLPSLPEVCAVCGDAGAAHIHRKLSFQPPWALALTIAGFIMGGLPGLFILMLTASETPVAIPVCQRHKHHGRRLVLFASMGWIIPFLTAGLAVIIIHFAVGDYAAAAGIPIGAVIGLLCYILPIIYLNVTSVKCEQTATDTVTISRVSTQFWKATREFVQLK